MNRTANDPRRRFDYSSVMSTLAVFIALSGTAIAADTIGTDDIIDNEVRSEDVRDDTLNNGGLTAADLKDDSVGFGEVADGSLTGVDIADGSLGGAEITASLTGADVSDSSLGGIDIDEASLAQVPSAVLGGFGRSSSLTTCDPESTTFIVCASTAAITVPVGARALVFGQARAFSEAGADDGSGRCRLGASSIAGGVPGIDKTFVVDDSTNTHEMTTLVGVTPPLTPGPTSFGIDCNQSDLFGAIQYDGVRAHVVVITSN